MREFSTLLLPFYWSIRNDIVRLRWDFYRKNLFYLCLSGFFIFVCTKLLNAGMMKLQNMSSDVFSLLLIKGYSLIFVVIFFIQIVTGIVISISTYYQSEDLELLFTSPVNRTALFFSRLYETHLKSSWMLVVFGLPLLISSGLLYKTDPLYYVYSLLLFAVFSTIPVNIGIAATILLLSLFHLRRLKMFLLSAGAIGGSILLVLFRMLRPERFINPELFANLATFLSEMNTPSYVLLPNRWLSEAIFNYLGKTFDSNTLIFVSLLILTSYLSVLLLMAIFRKFHYRGWELLHGGGVVVPQKRHAVQGKGALFIWVLLRAAGFQSGFVMQKDIRQHMRDVRTLNQTLIVLSLVVIYLFSIASLPLNWEGYAVELKYFVSFLNIGIILIIITALCSRVVYPDIVSEGSSFWLIKTSPLTPKRYVLTKFMFYFAPLLILGQLLILFSSYFMGVPIMFIAFSSITVLFLGFSLTAITIAFGMRDAASAGPDTTKTGTTAQMLTSVFLILFTLTVEAAPVFVFFAREKQKAIFTYQAWLIIGAALLTLLVINILVAVFSLRQGIRDFNKFQAN